MNKQTERARFCDNYCHDVYRCSVHWGEDCKKWGGRKIPRMKSIPRDFTKEGAAEKPKKSKGILEGIRTRVVGW